MELKEIVKMAKEYFADLYSDRIYNNMILLEEVEPLDNDKWKITLGFYEENVAKPNILTVAMMQGNLKKTYKILYLDSNGKVEKIKNYD
jgi:hypothetical protein